MHASDCLPSLVILRLLGHRDGEQRLLARALLTDEQSLVDGADLDWMLVLRLLLPLLQRWGKLDSSGPSAGDRAEMNEIVT